MSLRRYIQKKYLAHNISATCLVIELAIVIIVMPLCAVTNALALQPVVSTIMSVAAIVGVPCAVIAAQQGCYNQQHSSSQ